MTGTNHGMTGAVIALVVKEPFLAIPLSYASHYACDAIPHYGLVVGGELFDKKFNYTLLADFMTALVIMVILGAKFPSQKWVIWSCMVAAASPDLMWAYYNLYIEKIQHKKPHLGIIARFHTWIQWYQKPKGRFVEMTWFLMMGLIIFKQS